VYQAMSPSSSRAELEELATAGMDQLMELIANG
jgi:hypothetical protein